MPAILGNSLTCRPISGGNGEFVFRPFQDQSIILGRIIPGMPIGVLAGILLVNLYGDPTRLFSILTIGLITGLLQCRILSREYNGIIGLVGSVLGSLA
jgi:hypothetical protein